MDITTSESTQRRRCAPLPKYSLLSLCHSTPIFHLSTNTTLYINLIYIHLSIVHFSFIYSFHLLFLYSVNLSQYDICTPLRSTMSHCLAKYVTRRRQGAGESLTDSVGRRNLVKACKLELYKLVIRITRGRLGAKPIDDDFL